MRKYAIIGVGHVGATIAYTLVCKGIADELILIDTNAGKARAEQLDLQDAQARLDSRTIIKINDYHELADTDILFITSGNIHALDHASGNRWAEFEYTKQIVQDIAPKVKASGFNGVAIDTMNPCDAITHYFQRATGLSREQVFGTGTFLDTARMQKVVAEIFDCDPKNISGYVYGEHGESQFTAWSTVQVNGIAITDLVASHHLDLAALEAEARHGGWAVHSGKGYTSFAIATCAVKLSEAVFANARLACPVSAYSEKYGTYVGQPAIVGHDGIESVTTLKLTAAEEAKFQNSANTIIEKFHAFDDVLTNDAPDQTRQQA
ncbi:L-lactate dehydrogenase [Lactiplantibacillus fabifermentans]|uniref:L-2-hydroxyisocaproate dehydrogenase n=2 Tax=Lactiplantibacillus fabifermentans TaxID=483011 RepID=A0A0R2NHD0_9LACO|nr:L-lactate dehydrogenase [Lactiplantibacillus fabifermentans]ETY75451.1 L-2-hydroxyisocaproate dehydrogenase [Lactiplantibacillus fabifermentans T30PCM01]KRO24748.1 l-2-hydroxyisocaproate dehydrogenase [Lactiplantibacillus fabifermentans DSM 21115]